MRVRYFPLYNYYSCKYAHLQKCAILVMANCIKQLYIRKQ